ncbi:DUF3040 domain-containing protein [Paractinoplanes lichenicola]|uniref:DUF3040 domain-containing protein n=1 Tax=Paractinoplanes lichenicola TaxID=2802976 RepID=A0ABS1W5I8_9ACTN|nr:DUF3040 domain-containing protein [Actinoplanes lichenicola]MBL7261813.1 DUF3040 domain-containing protein [Actinoplanes lichenicola]
MLDPKEMAAFDGLVSQLHSTDPRFCRRMRRLSTPKPRLYTTAAAALWLLAPLCIIFGGWTGTLIAAVCCAYGFRLYNKRNGNAPQPAWWVATPRFKSSGPR